uniref:Clp R domain-containing protein n=2 Tax=Spongospora subterranea TaxID=70186 RepID=A0A0H5R4N4_9EUKA|eukprot:CRZ08851.1 hypothetical protein [Spongospora subterranea]
MSYQFTTKTNEILLAAQELALQHRHIELSPVHIAMALFSSTDGGIAQSVCNRIGTTTAQVVSHLAPLLSKLPSQSPGPQVPSDVNLSRAAQKVLQSAQTNQKSNKDSHLSADHLLMGLYADTSAGGALEKSGLHQDKVSNLLTSIRGSSRVTDAHAEDSFDALEKYGVNVTKMAMEGKLDPVIGRDEEIRRTVQVLCRRTKNNPVLLGQPGVGKTAIAEGLAIRLANGDVPTNLQQMSLISLDLGALIAGASHRGEFEQRLKAVLAEIKSSSRVILFIDEIHLLLGAGRAEGAMDAANLLKPMLARGELRCIGATTLDEYRKYVEKDAAFERRFQQVMVHEPSIEASVSILRGIKDKYEAHHGVTILDASLVAAVQLSHRYITSRFLPDKAIDLIDEACASTRVQLDSQPEIIDQLERRQLQLDVEATALEQEKDEASRHRLAIVQAELAKIADELQPLKLKHHSEKSRVDEIRTFRRKLDEVHRKIEQAERMKDLAKVADLRYGAVPELERKIEKLEEANRKRESSEDRLLSEIVRPQQIAEIVSRWTGIPVSNLTRTERERLLGLSGALHRRVVGQDEAIEAVANAVLRSRAGMSRPGQPLGSFLLLGSTGTGKTELAKALSEQLFDDEKNMIRLDMSEYSEQHSGARLIGAPPGYVGHDEGGQLTEAVRRRPFSVVLLDEIEKAHPQISNILLQVLDDGRLTDGKGRTIDFSNTVIILTSNLGSQYLLGAIANPSDAAMRAAKDKVMDSVRKHFRPEFINRLDDCVIFMPLQPSHLKRIAEIQILHIQNRLDDKHVQLQVDPSAMEMILQKGYDAVYGARPLKRYLEKNVVTEVSRLIIGGQLLDYGRVIISADKSSDKLMFTCENPPDDGNGFMEVCASDI